MRVYYRLLTLVKPIYGSVLWYIVNVMIAIIFSALNVTLLIPLLNTVFGVEPQVQTNFLSFPKFSVSLNNPKEYFEHLFYYLSYTYGKFYTLVLICSIIFLSNVLYNTFGYLSRGIMEKLRNSILLNLRNRIYDKIMALDIKFFNNSRKGDLISLASSDIFLLQNSFLRIIEIFSLDFFKILAYLAVLIIISPELTLFAMIVIPVASFLITTLSKKLKKQTFELQAVNDSLISLLETSIYGIKIIKAFNAVEFLRCKYHAYSRNYTDVNFKMTLRQMLASPLAEVLFLLTAIILILYGGNLIFTNTAKITPAGFITYLIIFVQIIMPIKSFFNGISGLYSGVAAGERIFRLLDHPIEITEEINTAQKVPELKTGISLKNVSFGYVTGERVLKNISFHIPKGKITAIVGPSGGGKSTITELLLRFYDVSSGEIAYDGINIKTLNPSSLRARISVVAQEPILFNDTIFNNIAFALGRITLEQVKYAAQMANIHDFIMGTPQQYQTNIGDRGMKLSGGQRQRIGIARAICHNPEIIILDEATSALDAQSEKLVQQAMDKIMSSRTSIVIAHRLSTIKNAHQIVVIDKGAVLEVGTHEQLINNQGLYKKLITLQSFD